MKPLPTAPNAEARAARHPQAPYRHHSGSRHQLSLGQLKTAGQDPRIRKLSGSSQMESQSSQTSSRHPSSSTQVADPGVSSSLRQESSPTQYSVSSQHSRQHSIPRQQQSPASNASPAQHHHSPHIESPRQRRPSREIKQGSFESPQLQHAISARRVSPSVRMSSERVPQTTSPEPALPTESEPAPLIPELSAPREPFSTVPQSAMAGKSTVSGRNKPSNIDSGHGHGPCQDHNKDDHEKERSGTDLPIQSPSTTKTPPQTRPPVLKRVSSHRITIMSTSDYSQTSPRRSLDNPVPRETSPELHRNSQGVVPSHKAYGSISFLPMHPLLSPLQDPSDLWESGNQNEPPKDRPQSPPNPPPASIPPPEPIPEQADTEGAVNTSHPLLLAERHTRFATKTTFDVPKVAKDLPLRHYRSSEAFQRARFGPSDEKEVFVPPKRSSSLVYEYTIGRVGNANPSSPYPTDLSPPAQSSATPSPLNVTQTQSALTPAPKLNLKSSKASIVTGTSSASVSTESAADDGATPPAISRSRIPLSHSKSTPNLSAAKPDDMEVSESVQSKKMSTKNAPIYLNPVSSTGLRDFLASTPPPSPPGRRAKSPTMLKSRGNYGPVGKHSGPFSIFPSSPRPASPGEKALAASNTNIDSPKSIPTPTSAKTEKKGWKRVFSGGSKKPKGGKGGEVPVLLKTPDAEKYKTKKTSTGKGHKKQLSEDCAPNGVGPANPEGSGFMGVGKDGVWISRKNFLRT